MRCSFDWIWSGVQGVQIACTIAQAQEFAWQWIHSGIDRPTSGGRGRRPLNAIAAARQRRQGQHPRRLRGLGKIPPPPRGGGAVSKRTYSPGQKEHTISAQHARTLAGAHARNAAHVERRHARAIADVNASMRACRAAAARFRRERNRLDRRNT